MEFEKYNALLEAVMPIIDDHFKLQKEYIKCKIGCSHCCQRGYYPVTRAEAKLIKRGFRLLPADLQEKITQKAEKIANEKAEFVREGNDVLKFKYECPFLEEDKCSIYDYRAIICRTQGLILQSISENSSFNMPACVYMGLNYGNVWDEQKQLFSEERIKELNLQIPPVALDFSYESLLEICGINPDSLLENLINPENNEIRMIFEWVTSENINKY